MKKKLARFIKLHLRYVLEEKVLPDQQKLTEFSYDNLALKILEKYIPDTYFPYTSSSLNFYKINFIINDIAMNSRESIIEFGAGYSTIVLANYIKSQSKRCKLLSIEHDFNFYKFLLEKLEELELLDYVELVHAPIQDLTIDEITCKWYSVPVVKDIVNSASFDLMVIDGPPAHKKESCFNRYPALPIIYQSLSNSYSLYLDDANRIGEKSIKDIWESKYEIQMSLISPSLMHSYRGDFLNPHF